VDLQTRFSETLKNPAIQRSFLPNQSAEDIFERSRIYGQLQESLGGLQWVRFIDSGGTRIHFSTYSPDILNQDRLSLSYRNYNDADFPYETIAIGDEEAPKYILDGAGDRILFSFPFYDSFDVYRGTALFSLSVEAVSDMLIGEGRIKVGQDISVVSDPPGFLYGISAITEKPLIPRVSSVWKEGGLKVVKMDSSSSGVSLDLITVKTSHGVYVGQLVNEDLFLFPLTMKIILLVSFFLTVYLTIFLLFNLRQDSVTIVQNRLKQLQISLIEQYYDRKSDMDWGRWSRELEQRREEIGAQLKRGIKTASKSKSADIDTLIDKSWDELLSVMGGRKDSSLDEEKLQLLLNRILSAVSASPVQISARAAGAQPVGVPSAAVPPAALSPATPQSQPAIPASAEAADEAEEVEDLEEAEEAETLEEFAEDAETAEELDEAEAAEEVVEAETVEELEELEEIESVEETGPAEEAEEPVQAVNAEPLSVSAAEVPIIDVTDMNLSVAGADELMQAGKPEDEIEELEELEELTEAEDEDAAAEESFSQVHTAYPGAYDEDLASLASQIEFSPVPETESGKDESIDGDLEIVSPFATMLSDFSSFAKEDAIFSPGVEIPEAPAIEESAESSELETLSPADDDDDNNDDESKKKTNL